MELKIQKVLLNKTGRIILISDIHGNLKVFQKLLDKVQFCKEDVLIIGGDIIEKGDNSLDTLRYVMKLYEQGNVFAVLGNCDCLIEEMNTQDPQEMKQIVQYMMWRKESLFYEFCEQLKIPVNEAIDLNAVRKEWNKHFKAELNFLAGLPHIIDAHYFLVAHAGLTKAPLEQQNPRQVMKYDTFIEDGASFSKPLFVGHMPVLNYCDTIGSTNPIYWQKRNIISMDGGNVIKDEGQLNAFVIENVETMRFSFVSVDELPQYVIKEAQEKSNQPIYISWFHNEIEIIEEEEEFSICRHVETGKEIKIPNDFIFGEETKHCYDITDYQLPLKPGDRISLIFRYSDCSYGKKNGVLGWISNDKIGNEVR